MSKITQKDRQSRTLKTVNNVSDILGAQANTRQIGIQSKRQTNPTNPIYTDLGEPKMSNFDKFSNWIQGK